MGITVGKFGGTSLATRSQIEKCLAIVRSDPSRKYVVVSAPGSRFKGDIKVTDLLIKAAGEFPATGRSAAVDEVIERFREILPENAALVAGLQEELQQRLKDTAAVNYLESIKAFGEYACALTVTGILKHQGHDAVCLDPRDFGLRITGVGNHAWPDPGCYRKAGRLLRAKAGSALAIIPGFYGYDKAGRLQTLPRGGSDTSGAAVARAVNAAVYENWTDEDGLKRADPRIVPHAATISAMTYDEARELAYMGFKLQDACFAPIKGTGIVLAVRNTNNPGHPGTMIMDVREVDPDERIVGVAREDGFITIGMRKMYIDREVGFGRKMLSVPEKLHLPYEHTPDGVDSAALVLARKHLHTDAALNQVVDRLKKVCRPDTMMVRDMSLVSVAGAGMKNHFDVHARAFAALAREKIAIRMVDDGADDLSFFIGVDQERSSDAVRAIYAEFYAG
ncbi:MAG: aspartate kinase [Kiritimatiellia bacterium]|nr:aspartate kinase [Lentisphaerota bacterium]